MKRFFSVVILVICSAAAFTQEIVGNVTVNNRYVDIDIDVDFYDDTINLDSILEIIKAHIITTQSKGLITVDYDVSDNLMDILMNLDVDNSDFSYNWGNMTQYYAIKYAFIYEGKEYFVIQILPEDNYWFFEVERN